MNVRRTACDRGGRQVHGSRNLHQHRRAAPRLQLDDSSLLAEWKLAYRRGYMMQASLAIAGGLFGVVAFFSTFEWRWLLGAVILLVNWPYTIIVIMPTNHRLMNTPAGGATAETRRMIRRWGILHAGRSVLGLAATLVFLWAAR